MAATCSTVAAAAVPAATMHRVVICQNSERDHPEFRIQKGSSAVCQNSDKQVPVHAGLHMGVRLREHGCISTAAVATAATAATAAAATRLPNRH